MGLRTSDTDGGIVFRGIHKPDYNSVFRVR
jgi:hypothetical protein